MQSSADVPVPGLAARLRTDTRSLHTELERSVFMQALLRGALDRPAYCLLLRSLHPIYQALEAVLPASADDAAVATLLMPPLFRTHALEQDLTHLHGAHWSHDLPVQDASRHYVHRLHRLQQGDRLLLVAHAYVRYLGDLSGGQLLQRIVANSLSLEAGCGTSFYDFGAPEQVAALAREFRFGLDRVSAEATQTDRIVAEAICAFGLHRALFDQLALAAQLSGNGAVKAP